MPLESMMGDYDTMVRKSPKRNKPHRHRYVLTYDAAVIGAKWVGDHIMKCKCGKVKP